MVQIYATGAGVWNPAVRDGQLINPFPPFPLTVAAVSLTIGGQPAQIEYAGPAPDLRVGILQVNAYVPRGTPGPQPVVLTVGQQNNSQQQVTVAVR